MNKRKVEIRRRKQFVFKLVPYNIYINGEKVGKIKNGETKIFELNNEDNIIIARADMTEVTIKIKVHEGETSKLELGSKITGLESLLVFFYMIFKPSKILYFKKIS